MTPQVEPWLRGTLTDLDPIHRAVVHALQLAGEDAARWAAPLTETELFSRPSGLPSVAFQLLHIARSLDRLLTYAEGHALSEAQLAALSTEMAEGNSAEVLAEFREGLSHAITRVLALSPDTLAQPRGVGRKQIPTTVAGLVIHCAEHTQRHTGQLVTTAKVVLAVR